MEMTKHITYIESSTGNGIYSVVLESEKGGYIKDGFFIVEDATAVKCANSASNSRGTIKESERYNILRFPINSTIVTEKIFEY
jgi:hypothetical protein